jgi:hypothetical protein
VNLSGNEFLLIVILLVLIVLPFWGLVRAILDKRTGWAISILVGGFVPPIGLLLAVIYLAAIRKRQVPAPEKSPAVGPGPLAGAGWLEDPSGQHQLRYWDGVAWTSQVSNDGAVETSPLMTGGPPPPPPS